MTFERGFSNELKEEPRLGAAGSEKRGTFLKDIKGAGQAKCGSLTARAIELP